ncbi:hypothetical protein MMC15_001875 [Xylographa vitiligo]|nr:hypothetical protein [Xylographa vitiligo]
MAEKSLTEWIKNQKLKAPGMKDAHVFYRNLEEALDVRRAEHAMFTRTKSAWKTGNAFEFCSNDLLSLGSSGEMRIAFLEELAAHPNFAIYSGGSRLADGNYDYIEQVEQEIADFHGAETALMVNSGWEANVAIYSAIPRPGDVIVYDEFVHANTHDGMVHSLSLCKMSFRHNDVDAFREVLASVVDTQPMIRAMFALSGDAPGRKRGLPVGNAVFVVDEAHGTGVLGPKGSGLVCKLGLEKEIAIRLHTCGKALASSNAVILGNATVRNALMNYARAIIYTTAPSFPAVAAVRAGVAVLGRHAEGTNRTLNQSIETLTDLQRQDNIQHLVKHFYSILAANPIWEKATEMRMLYIPISEDWESRDWHAHIVPLWTRQRYNYWLVFHLQLLDICAFPIDHPTVPKGQGRIRLMFHGGNTEAEVETLASTICAFAREMIDIEEAEDSASKVPVKAQQVYALMAGA